MNFEGGHEEETKKDDRAGRAWAWLSLFGRARGVLASMHQPLTARQVSKPLDLNDEQCSVALRTLRRVRLAACLNPEAKRHRLYWLTPLGRAFQARLRSEQGLARFRHDFPRVDWRLYGAMCSNYRSAILKTLKTEMSTREICRYAAARDPRLRMSHGNTHETLAFLVKRQLVLRLQPPGSQSRRYELTDTGRRMQVLLQRAEAHPSVFVRRSRATRRDDEAWVEIQKEIERETQQDSSGHSLRFKRALKEVHTRDTVEDASALSGESASGAERDRSSADEPAACERENI